MDVETAIRGRRSVRNYLPQKVAASNLEKIADIVRYAPTASNSQAWKLRIITDERSLADLVSFAPGIWKKPPAILVISMDYEAALKRSGKQALEETIYYDAGIAAYVASLAAFNMGVGSCIVASFNKRAVAALLDIESPIEPMLLVTLGYTADHTQIPARKLLEEVLDKRWDL